MILDGKKLTTTDAARILGCSRREIRRKIGAGVLRAEKAGRDWLINPRDLEPLREKTMGAPRLGFKED